MGWRAGRTAIRYLLPADWYVLPIVSYASSTEILRFAQNDEPGGEEKHVTQAPSTGRSWGQP